MEDIYLTVKEVSELKGCTERYVRTLIEKGKMAGMVVDGLSTGQGGIQYRVPLSSLDSKLQLKYRKLQRKQEREAQKAEAAPQEESITELDEEALTAAERQEIALWKEILNEWRTYRHTSGLCKAEADDSFVEIMKVQHPDLGIKRRTLYRKWNGMQDSGDAALLDKRGKHGNHNKKLTDSVWDIFEAFYLDESQKSVSLCVTLTELELERQVKEGLLPRMPELPKADAFNRRAAEIPMPYIEYFRHGMKSFIGNCEPYIKRMYEGLEANAIWVADNHTFDIMLYDGTKTLRLYLTAFMDVRTRKMMGWCVTDRPCSDATINALRKGIEKYGIPDAIYTDNGREFLFHDFGGNGFRRKRKISPEEFKPPTILNQLGIEFRTALPRNARAKGVERAFNTLKNTFSKLFEAYTGGNVVEKPERLKEVVKNPDKLKRVKEFSGFVDTWLAGWYNKQPHSGEGMYGRSPDEAFAELLVEQRQATEAQLNLMFMRWSNPMKVGKNGVTLTFYGKKLQYFEHGLWERYCGKEVYVRYDPDNLNEVRVYDMEERFICKAQLLEELSYNASKEEIAKAQKERRASVKQVSNYLAEKGIKNHDALELVLDKAVENLAEGEDINPKYIRPTFGGEKLAKAVGYDVATDEDIDWTSALQNLKRNKGDE